MTAPEVFVNSGLLSVACSNGVNNIFDENKGLLELITYFSLSPSVMQASV